MGIIYAYPGMSKRIIRNPGLFSELIKDYPGSGYRKDSEMMIFQINNVIVKIRRLLRCKHRSRLSSKRSKAGE